MSCLWSCCRAKHIRTRLIVIEKNMNWIIIDTEEKLQQAFERSFSKDICSVLLFKHSVKCRISKRVKDLLESSWQGTEETPVYFLDLINFRELSNKITDLTGVVHQSPQAILIKNGKVLYHASHADIVFEDMQPFVR